MESIFLSLNLPNTPRQLRAFLLDRSLQRRVPMLQAAPKPAIEAVLVSFAAAVRSFTFDWRCYGATIKTTFQSVQEYYGFCNLTAVLNCKPRTTTVVT
jgi:hypothetical protein